VTQKRMRYTQDEAIAFAKTAALSVAVLNMYCEQCKDEVCSGYTPAEQCDGYDLRLALITCGFVQPDERESERGGGGVRPLMGGGMMRTRGRQTQMATVRDIVTAYLVANGYDGLLEPYGECGCVLDDLMTCVGWRDHDETECEPAYRTDCNCEEEHEFHMVTTKPG